MLNVNDLMSMGFSRTLAYNLMGDPEFPTVKIGKRLFVRSDKLMEYLDAHTAKGVTNAEGKYSTV